jgi:hypothetical protein
MGLVERHGIKWKVSCINHFCAFNPLCDLGDHSDVQDPFFTEVPLHELIFPTMSLQNGNILALSVRSVQIIFIL